MLFFDIQVESKKVLRFSYLATLALISGHIIWLRVLIFFIDDNDVIIKNQYIDWTIDRLLYENISNVFIDAL